MGIPESTQEFAASSDQAITPAISSTPIKSAFPTTFLGIGITYDQTRNEVVIFGGIHSLTGKDLAETWTWDGQIWTRHTPSISPAARRDAALAYDPSTQQVLLFGGFNQEQNKTYNDTWSWDGRVWTERQPMQSPSPRYAVGIVGDLARREVLLYGGTSSGRAGLPLNDTWTWDGKTWKQIAPTNAPPAIPGPTLVYDSAQQQILFSASQPTGLQQQNDLWAWNGQIWTKITQGAGIPARYNNPAAYDESRKRLVIFGGIDFRSGSSLQYLTDTWEWDGQRWTRASGQVPAAGNNLATQVVCESMLKEKKGPGTLTLLRESHLVYDAARQNLLLLTASREEPSRFTIWIWKGNGWEELRESAGEPPNPLPAGEGWVRILDGNKLSSEDKVKRWLESFKPAEIEPSNRLVDFKILKVDGPFMPETKDQGSVYRIYKVQVSVKPFLLAGSTWNDNNGKADPGGWIIEKQIILGEWYQHPLVCDTWMKIISKQ